MILVENMVAGALVHRDFEPLLANFGDVVNTRRPADFTAKRKDVNDNVTVQDATATNVPVRLDQHIHTSFLIRDGEESKSFKDLVEEFLKPAVIAQARMIDRIVLAQYPHFLGQSYGDLGGLTGSTVKDGILGLRQKLNVSKVPIDGRNLILNPVTEGTALSLDLFLSAQNVGDSGEALQNATLGRRLGFDMYMDQNMASVASPGSTGYTSDTTAANINIGDLTVTLTTGTATNLVAGAWLVVTGDGVPHQIASFNSGTKVVTLTTAFSKAVTSGAVVTIMKLGQINLSGGYAAGWSKEILVDTFAIPLVVGQFLTFDGDATNVYTVVDVNGSTGITLDRPLVAAVTNDQKIWPGPFGNYSFAFRKEAMALVVRPLAKPKAGTGALSAVMNWNDLSMRSTITYDKLAVVLKSLCMLETPSIPIYAQAA